MLGAAHFSNFAASSETGSTSQIGAHRVHSTHTQLCSHESEQGKMVVEALLLPQNDHADAMLEHLGNSSAPSAKHLTIIQNAAIYYQCLVTKHQAGTMSTAKKHLHVRTNYKNFTVPSFFCWWKTVCNLDPPSWLTLDIMGMTTQTDKGERHMK